MMMIMMMSFARNVSLFVRVTVFTRRIAGWDELTMMPSGEHAQVLRSKASAVLAGVIHQKSIDHELGKLIADSQPSHPKDIANVKRAKEEYERSAEIPSDMAKKAAELQSEGYLSQYTPLLVRPLLRTV
jgi:Zn-dependent M32 family carboxypeptidase